MLQVTKKVQKNQFKCFQCRDVYPQKEGNWVNWNQMQVHLCLRCGRETEARPERKLPSAQAHSR